MRCESRPTVSPPASALSSEAATGRALLALPYLRTAWYTTTSAGCGRYPTSKDRRTERSTAPATAAARASSSSAASLCACRVACEAWRRPTLSVLFGPRRPRAPRRPSTRRRELSQRDAATRGGGGGGGPKSCARGPEIDGLVRCRHRRDRHRKLGTDRDASGLLGGCQGVGAVDVDDVRGGLVRDERQSRVRATGHGRPIVVVVIRRGRRPDGARADGPHRRRRGAGAGAGGGDRQQRARCVGPGRARAVHFSRGRLASEEEPPNVAS